MPRSDRLNAHAHTSPLDALKALDRNLKRERRVFAMLIALLIFAALCLAAVALGSLGANVLREQRLEARAASAQANARLERQFAVLASMATLVAASGTSPPSSGNRSASCSPAFGGSSGDSPDLLAACEQFVEALQTVSPREPILLLRVDGSAAYSRNLAPSGPQLAPGRGARLLADTVLLRMSALGTDPVTAAKKLKVIWFRPSPALGFANNLVLGALCVLKEGKPYAFAITGIDIDSFGHAAVGSAPDVPATLFDASGNMLRGPLSPAGAQYLDRQIADRPSGVAYIVPRFGLVERHEPFAHDFGHYMFTLTWRELIVLLRVPLIIVLVLTASLVALLVTLSRYWNRRVLARTYDEATRALEGELLNHLLVHATPVGLCIVRRSNFEIVVANQIVRNVLGLDEHATRLPNALCAEFEKHSAWPAQPNDETPVFELPFSLERPGEEGLHLAITYAPATMNREDVMFCAVADMSKHYEVERLLREAKRLSDEAARAKVSFFAAMSHEIRTPLASLVGNIELLARGPLAPEQGARVQAMEISAAELLQIVSDVLDFSKIDVGQMKLAEAPGSVAALLGRVVLAHAPLAVRQRLPFYLVMDRDIPAQLHFDAVRLAQIVNNLLSNAFKFTRSGKIVLRARWREDALEVSVSDSGSGISEDLKRHLFQPFTQGDDQRLTQARGTGLGLSICARLAGLMHGRIELDSALGVGTRVTVTLPLRRDGDAIAGDEWTLPDAHPAIVCRAPENREWLANLFGAASTPTFLTLDEPPLEGAPREGAFDYLLVTDEFTPDDIARVRADGARVIWLRQDGPLIPREVDAATIEVSIYSLPAIRAATRMAESRVSAPGDARQSEVQARAEEESFVMLRVLIAEDNLLNRTLLRDQLRTLGAKVIEAKDGEEALARLEENRVDVMLTDLNMPVMNGYALLKAARETHPDLPIYAVSSDALPEQIAQGRSMGFTDYLSKPVSLADLTRALAGVAARIDPARGSSGSDDSDSCTEAELPRFPELSQALADIFIDQADRDLADFSDLARQRDFARLRDWAHRVSGGLAVLGPSMLSEACLELRATMREAGAWTEEVDELAAAVAAELEALRAIAAHRDGA